MSYASCETSRENACPVLLYQFAQGASVWRYAAFPVAISVGGHSWQSESIEPAKFVQSGESPREELEITLPETNSVAALFAGSIPDGITTLTILRTHYGDGETRYYWKGRVQRASRSSGAVTLTCEPIAKTFDRIGNPAVTQRICRRIFGGRGCNVNRDTFGVSAQVLGVSGPRVTLYIASPPTTWKIVGGVLKAPGGELRRIVGTWTSGYVLSRAASSIVSGGVVTLLPECDRSMAMCHGVFDNLGNYGAEPCMSTVNPFNTASVVF